jgi:hypothetical protein
LAERVRFDRGESEIRTHEGRQALPIFKS